MKTDMENKQKATQRTVSAYREANWLAKRGLAGEYETNPLVETEHLGWPACTNPAHALAFIQVTAITHVAKKSTQVYKVISPIV